MTIRMLSTVQLLTCSLYCVSSPHFPCGKALSRSSVPGLPVTVLIDDAVPTPDIHPVFSCDLISSSSSSLFNTLPQVALYSNI